ncbi:MAG TPA: hypothetical protein VFR07_05355 [Mycobacteriales bacterium]|jgi:hypothetical protein|nr:hypothetical protein [Mycobacteriales bacterium]
MRPRTLLAPALAVLLAGSALPLLAPGPALAAGPTPAPAPAPATAPAAAQPERTALWLPRPTGPFLTGTTLLHLRDRDRVDPLDPEQRRRELRVQVFYPAASTGGRPLAPYAPPGEVAALQAFYPVPKGAFTVQTHSRLQAPVRAGTHKVVFFHHGLCASRTDTTAVNEQLASQGFVVVALASTHESPAVEFPGGRVEKTTDPEYCLAGGDPYSAKSQRVLKDLLAVRVADTRYVLDQLIRLDRGANPDVAGAPLPPGIAGTLDTEQVGIYGHSFGGATAAAVMREDRRFVAGVNLDGLLVGPVERSGLDKPFLVMGSSYHSQASDPSWASFLPRLSGWHRWFRVQGAGHYRFIDLGGSVRRWGLDETLKQQDPETWRLVFGDIGDGVSSAIVRTTTAAFFDRFLRGRAQPLLSSPHAYFPQLQDRTDRIDPAPRSGADSVG